MSGSYRFRNENQWQNFHKLHLPEDVHYINKLNSWYSQSNGSKKDPMAYGGMAYYDNATYAGPHSKGSFSGGSSDHPDYTYRRGKHRCCVAITILVLLLFVGIGVFLGVYFGVMDKPDKISDIPQYEKGKFQTSLKINQNWDSKYADQSSSEYQNLKSRLDNQLTSMYQGSSLNNEFQKVEITDVSQGSIVVVYIVILEETTVHTPSYIQTVTEDRIQQIKNDVQSTSDLLKAVDVNLISVSSVPLTTTLVPPSTTTTSTTTVATTATTTTTVTTPPPKTTVTTSSKTTEGVVTQPDLTTQPQPETSSAPTPPKITTDKATTKSQPQPVVTTTSTAPPSTKDDAVVTTKSHQETTTDAAVVTTKSHQETTTDAAVVTTKSHQETTTEKAQTQPPVTQPDTTTSTTFLDGNPCTNHSLLESFSITCIQKSSVDLINAVTPDGKCSVLLEKVLPCILTETQTKYGKTCTKKQQHNIIIANKDSIQTFVQIDPQTCLPSSSCSDIEAVTYYIAIVCEDQTNKLIQSGSCSDFSDVLKCYFYHVGSSCNSTELYSTISNSYNEWNKVIGQPPPNSCSVGIDWIDATAKTSLCSDPDAADIMVNMYCPNDLREFVMAGTAEKCMKANNLVVCMEQQMKAVLKTTCTIDNIYNVMAMYQSNITSVSNQPSIIDCHTQEQTTEEMTTTTEAATTTATVVIVDGEFEANMKVNQTWDPIYKEKNSTEYKDLTENFRNQTLALYNYKNSSVQVEDIIVVHVSPGSLVFDFIIILVKTLPDIDEWTAEKLIEKTVEIIEAIQKDPEVILDLIQTVDTKKIKVNQKVEVLTECDRVGYVKPIVQNKCNNAMTRLFQVPDNQTRCEIFLQVVGCVVFHAQQCSVAKVTRTISNHFNAMKSFVVKAGNFDPTICYASEKDLVLPTMMPVTAQVKPCLHPDVLSYIMNFDCHYDAISTATKDNASLAEKCKFYWMSAACVYQKAQENPLLQSYGRCTFEDTKQVLVNYANRMFKVRPKATASQCYAYKFNEDECATYLYDPNMYNSFQMCFMELFQINTGMKGNFDLSNMTCRIYKEAAQCLYRQYQTKGNNSCDWMEFGKNAAWMINAGSAQWSQFMDKNYNEPNVVKKCIDEATSDSDFGQSICVDGEALILSSMECISDTLMKAGDGICQSLKNHYIPCVQKKVPTGINCDNDEIEKSIMMETDLIEKLTRKKVIISKCTGETDKSSNRFNITIKLMMDWDSEYADESSPEYQNLTSEFIKQMTMATTDFSSMIEYMKVVDVRQGSVIIVLELKYTMVLTLSNILTETQKIISDAKMDQNSQLTLLSIVDENSIVVKAYDDDFVSDDYCVSYRAEISNLTQCGMAVYGFANKSNIDQQLLCSGYTVYLSCLKTYFDRMGKDCKLSSLNQWILYTLPYYLTNETVQQVNKCSVDDDYRTDCNDNSLMENLALHSGCAGYIPYLDYQDCNSVWRPYLMCVANVYPSCPEREIAEKLLTTAGVSTYIPQGFDVMERCFSDDPALDESTLFKITLKLMIDWDPDYADKSSPQYQNLTSQLINEMNIAAAAANYTDLIDYMKITEVRQGSVYVVFEVRYNIVIKTTDIMSGTRQMVTGAQMDPYTPLIYLKTVDMNNISVKALKDETSSGYDCSQYNQDIVEINSACTMSMSYLYNRTNISSEEICRTYDVLLTCIHQAVEIKNRRECKKTDLHKWMPYAIQVALPNIQSSQMNMCPVTNDPFHCNNTKLFERYALGICYQLLYRHLSSSSCQDVWVPYIKCTAGLFPRCPIKTITESLMTSPNFTSLLPQGFDVLDSCFSDDPIMEDSTLFSITLKLMIDWDPDYADKSSPQYRKLTSQLMEEMNIAATAANYTDLIDYMKITEVRQGSVYVVFEVRYNIVIKTTDILSGTRQMVTGAQMNPNTPLIYLKTVDMNSVSVKALKDNKKEDYCHVHKEEITNNTQCANAMYWFVNKTSIPEKELCGAYSVYLMCIKLTVERMGKKCELSSLHRWMPYTFPYYLKSVTVDQVNKCDVDDAYRTDCNDISLMENLALHSGCAGYIPYLDYQDCNSVWRPYLMCVANVYPSCPERDIAEKLLSTVGVSKYIPGGFDVMVRCFPDDPVMEESSLFLITLKLMIEWDPDYADKSSPKYRNLTSQLTNEMNIAAAANYTDLIDYMKITEVRQGSVYVVFEVRYNIVIKTTVIMWGTRQMVTGAQMDPNTPLIYLKTVDMNSISVTALKDEKSGYDCSQSSQDVVEINSACAVAISYLHNRTNISPKEICRAYDVALTCIQQSVEMKTRRECKKTDLHKWMPHVIQGALPNIQSSQTFTCPVTNDPFHCNNTKLFESYAVGICYQLMYRHLSYSSCRDWVPYVNCTAGLFPQCPIKTVANSLMTSDNFTSLIPQGFDVDSCFPGQSSTKYRISMKFDMMWMPVYADSDSEEYMNLTREIMNQMRMAISNYTDTISTMKIVELKQGSVIVVFEVQYRIPISEDDIKKTSIEIVMAAKMQPHLYLLQTIDPTSIDVELLEGDQSGYDCSRYSQNILEINPACGMSMSYLSNRTNISSDEICRTYDVGLTCIQQAVEIKTSRECKKTDLHKWMSFVIQGLLPNIQSSQMYTCPVTDGPFHCNNTQLFESYALGVCYQLVSKYLAYPDCRDVWVPYINCTAGLFPRCQIKTVAESLMTSPNFTSLIPQGFDVMDSCFPERILPSYMVSLRFEMPWQPEYANEESEEYKNLTSEVMRQMMIATVNQTINSLKIYEVKQGSVVIVIEVQLFEASTEDEVKAFVTELVWSIKRDPNSQLHMLKTIDPYRIEIDEVPDWLKDDVCQTYRLEILTVSAPACGLVLFGLANKTDIDMDYFCTAYNVYLTCVKEKEEEKWKRDCKKSSLDMWIPMMIQPHLPHISVDKYRMCNVTQDVDVCTDVKSITAATVQSVCAYAFIFLHLAPSCNATVGAFNCVMSILPSCKPEQILTTMKKSANLSALIPANYNPMNCFGDVCRNYTDLIEKDDCVKNFGEDSNLPYDIQCRRYNLLASCLQNNIKKQGQECRKDSLLSWLPRYLNMKYNMTGVQNCSITSGSVCHDLATIEIAVLYTDCKENYHFLKKYPSCLNAKTLVKCVMSTMNDCDNYTLARTLMMSNHSLVPSTIDMYHCLRAQGFYKFHVNFTMNMTWSDNLNHWNSTQYKDLTRILKHQMMDLFSNDKLHLYKQIEEVDIIGYSPGSVKVHSMIEIESESPFYKSLTAVDLQQELVMSIEWLQNNPPSKHNYFTSVIPNSVLVQEIWEPEPPMTTYRPYTTTAIVPSCDNPAYIKKVIESNCESAKSQLLRADKNQTCRIFNHMVGCTMFNTIFMCSEEEIVALITRHPVDILGLYYDTGSCHAPGTDVVLPTIVPKNSSLSPCSYPDVIQYLLNYDCYYYGMMDYIQGTSQMDSCRFYWYSTSCVYQAMNASETLPSCSYKDIMDTITKYENDLFQVSPTNVDLKYCMDNGKGSCARIVYGPDFYQVAMTCYGNALANRVVAGFGLINVTADKCLIYEEMFECMYRAYQNNCSKTEMEEEAIWATNALNNVMTIAMGQNLKEKDVVFGCIANSSKKADFGQDICYDGPGLIMSNISCLMTVWDCNSFQNQFVPCVVRSLAMHGIRCDKHLLYSSLIKESALMERLWSHADDLSSCGKVGMCPVVFKSSDSNRNSSSCVRLCSDDWSCPKDEKCCPHGCGLSCVAPVIMTTSMPYTTTTSADKRRTSEFVVSIPFDMPWDPMYEDRRSEVYRSLVSQISREIVTSSLLTSGLALVGSPDMNLDKVTINNKMTSIPVIYHMKQLYSVVGHTQGFYNLSVTGLRKGSVIADILEVVSIDLYSNDEIYETTIEAIKGPLSNSTLFQKVILEKVSVYERKESPMTTYRPYTTTTIAPSCNNPAYIKTVIESQCGAARSHLAIARNHTCRVLNDLVGCTIFSTRFICSEEEVMALITKYSNVTLGFYHDTSSCHAPDSDVVLPTIVPKNSSLSPCFYPDVIHYVLNYDCYYSGLMDSVQDTSQIDSCRFYWFSTSCVYLSMNTRNNCSNKDIMDTITKYEDDLFEVSPANVDLKYCMDNGRGTCAKMVYGPNFYQVVMTCYGKLAAARNFEQLGFLNMTNDKCLIYEEMFECMYRAYQNNCSKTEMEEEAIWATDALNNIMTIAIGQNLKEDEHVVNNCMANSSQKTDFGQDICQDGPGLLISGIACVVSLRDCNSFQNVFIPCVAGTLAMQNISCDKNVLYSSLVKESSLLKRLMPSVSDLSTCGKVGMCPVVFNSSDSNRNNSSCMRLCSDDLSCPKDEKCCSHGCNFTCVAPVINESEKEGTCPNVTGAGICIHECSSDYECGGRQKCCSNGCGSVCTDPVEGASSNRFNVSLTFDIPWKDEYRQNETYKAAVVKEVQAIVDNSSITNYVKSVEVKTIKPGSTIVFLEIYLWVIIPTDEMKQHLDMMVKEVQGQSMYTWLQKIKHIAVNSLPGWNTNTTITQPTPTGVTTTIGGATSHTPVPSPPPVNYMCYGSWGSCASDTNCHLVTWYYNYQVQSIMINITAAVGSDKWLGIGFNHQKKMGDADAVVGWVTPEGVVVVTDRKNVGYSSALDTKQNVHNVQGFRSGGITSISFSKNRTSSDHTQDISFNVTNGAYFLYPLGGTYSADKSITMHEKTPAISTNMFTFPCSDLCKSLDFFRMWAPQMCSAELSKLKESDDQDTFCRNLDQINECVKSNLPQYGCSSEIDQATYSTLINLLNEVIPFDISAKVIPCLQ